VVALRVMALDTDVTSVTQDLVTVDAFDGSDLDRVVRFGAWGAHLDTVLLRIATATARMIVGMMIGPRGCFRRLVDT
jgi:hypothetical protein